MNAALASGLASAEKGTVKPGTSTLPSALTLAGLFVVWICAKLGATTRLRIKTRATPLRMTVPPSGVHMDL
jgi:hypothetical protein